MDSNRINAGHLDRKITIQHPVETTDGFGQAVIEWQTWKEKIWAGKTYKDSGQKEDYSENRLAAEWDVVWTIRYLTSQTDPKLPTPKMQIIETEALTGVQTVYDVFVVSEIGRRAGWKLKCKTRF